MHGLRARSLTLARGGTTGTTGCRNSQARSSKLATRFVASQLEREPGSRRILRDLARNTSMTMLLVTHEMGFAREIGDRVVMFDQGQVIEEAPPEELFSSPKLPRTQDFLRAVLEHA